MEYGPGSPLPAAAGDVHVAVDLESLAEDRRVLERRLSRLPPERKTSDELLRRAASRAAAGGAAGGGRAPGRGRSSSIDAASRRPSELAGDLTRSNSLDLDGWKRRSQIARRSVDTVNRLFSDIGLTMSPSMKRAPSHGRAKKVRQSVRYLQMMGDVDDYQQSILDAQDAVVETALRDRGTSLSEIDIQLVRNRPRAASATARRPSVDPEAPLGFQIPQPPEAAAERRRPTGRAAALAPGEGEGGEGEGGRGGGSDGAEGEDGETEWYIHPRHHEDSAMHQVTAYVCIKNAMEGKTFSLRYATPAKLALYKVQTSTWYGLVLSCVVLLHCSLGIWEPVSFRENDTGKYPHWGARKRDARFIELAVVCFYGADLALTFACTNRRFLRSWRSAHYRMALVALMAADLAASFCTEGEYLRFSRVLRPVLFILNSRIMRQKLTPVVYSLFSVMKAISIVIFLLIIFGVAGMELFGSSRDWIQFEEERETCGFDFQNIGNAIVSLYGLITSETYPCGMIPALRGRINSQDPELEARYLGLGLDQNNPNDWVWARRADMALHRPLSKLDYYDLQQRGHTEAIRSSLITFFLSFLLLTTFGFVNIIVAVVYATYRKHSSNMILRTRIEERKALLVAFELLAPVDGDNSTLDFATFTDLVKNVMGKDVDKNLLRFYWDKTDEDKSGKVDAIEFLALADIPGLTVVKLAKASDDVEYAGWQVRLQRYVQGKFFKFSMLAVIVCNICLICAKGLVRPERYRTLQTINENFTFLYLLEMLIKLLALRPKKYWDGVWNRFDAFCNFIGVVAYIISRVVDADQVEYGTDVGPHRVFKLIEVLSTILRIVRLITINKEDSNQFLLLLFQAMPHMLALLMFLGLVMYIYAIVGMELFSGNYPNGVLPADPLAWAGYTDLYAYANFESFGNAMLLLFQLVSTSNWHELYLTGRTTLHEQMGNRAAAYAISSVYFITFMILMVNIILNLVLAVFVDSWTQMTVISKRLKAKMKAISDLRRAEKAKPREGGGRRMSLNGADYAETTGKYDWEAGAATLRHKDADAELMKLPLKLQSQTTKINLRSLVQAKGLLNKTKGGKQS